MREGGRRCKLPLHDLKEKRRNRNLKRKHYYTHSGTGYGLVTRQTTK
jgi:hypothetical protein